MDLERIGPYLIEHKIGSGGMGTVYLAHHAESGDEVALKVLPPALAREDGFVARFEREIDALQKLINPHIVSLLGSGVDDGTYYYAMEYVEGETLTDKLRREKRIPWRDVLSYSLQICSALKSAHDAGIIHRDLKPSNLLLDKQNNVKLTDFGVAQVFAAGRLTLTGGIIGTAEYMSPEQAHGKRANKKSDLYSLGAVMFTMLTGRPPFVGKTTLEVIHKHKYGTFDKPSRFVEGIPRRLEETVCQLLEKDPEKRFADALVLSRRLEDILRRAEVADQEETRIADGQSTGSGPRTAFEGQTDSPIRPDELGGTLMRDLVRAEVEQTLGGGSWGHFFNNTWVLLAGFLLLIAGGVLWFQLVGKPADSEDLTSLQDDTLLVQAQNHLKNHLRDSSPKASDPLLRGAIVALESGDPDKAERYLVSYDYLLQSADKPRKLPERVENALKAVRALQTQRKELEHPHDLAHVLLKQAAELVRQEQFETAEKICRSIIDLYDREPDCRKPVAEARALLKTIQQQRFRSEPANPEERSEDDDSPPPNS